MDPRKLSELVPFLKERDLLPKRSLSQNFLIDPNILEKIALYAEIKPGELILEIGPGLGALTKTLLEKGAHVLAIEQDQRLIPSLREICPSEHLEIIHGSILEIPFPQEKMKIVSNIPYHISSAIVERIALHAPLFENVFLTVQKEFALRFQKPSALTTLCHFLYQVKTPFWIPAACFWPRPDVDSALLALHSKQRLPLEEIAPFYQFLQKVFQNRRKMIRSLLGTPHAEEILTSLNLRSDTRAETLSPDLLFSLYLKVQESDPR